MVKKVMVAIISMGIMALVMKAQVPVESWDPFEFRKMVDRIAGDIHDSSLKDELLRYTKRFVQDGISKEDAIRRLLNITRVDARASLQEASDASMVALTSSSDIRRGARVVVVYVGYEFSEGKVSKIWVSVSLIVPEPKQSSGAGINGTELSSEGGCRNKGVRRAERVKP